METLTLVENIRARRDVETSQEVLYARIREALLLRIDRKIPKILRPRVDAEDVLHDAFLRAMGALDLFQPSSERAFFAWVYSIAKNLLIDNSRRQSVRNIRFGVEEGDAGPRVSQIDTNERRAESMIQRREWIEANLNRLSAKEAEVIRLHKLRGLSFAEIAATWKKTPGAVQRFYSRAVHQLRSLVEKGAEGEG